MGQHHSIEGTQVGLLRVGKRVSLPGDVKRISYAVTCSECSGSKTMLFETIKRTRTSCNNGCWCKGSGYQHGLWNHPAYKTWEGMIARCENPKHQAFARYGGRGISVCQAWRERPAAFFDWLDENNWRRGLHVDRVDNDRGYEPSNCRVVSVRVNQNNKPNNRRVLVAGRIMTLAEAAAANGLNYTTVRERLQRGWNIDEALKPARSYAAGR